MQRLHNLGKRNKTLMDYQSRIYLGQTHSIIASRVGSDYNLPKDDAAVATVRMHVCNEENVDQLPNTLESEGTASYCPNSSQIFELVNAGD